MSRLSLRLPSIRSAAGAFAIAIVAVSVITAVSKSALLFAALAPELVLSGYVWQLFTYAFVETSPIGVIFGALIAWNLGGLLESVWGRKRFITFAFGVSAIGALMTVLLSLLVPSLTRPLYAGGGVLTGSMWVAYGLHLGRAQTNFWGAAVTGNGLALIGAGFTFLNAAFAGLSAVIPDAFALLATFLYMRGVRPSELLIRFRSWQFERQFKKRSAHLQSIDGGRGNSDRGSDRYLH